MLGKCVLAACAAMVASSIVHGQCADWRARGTGIYYQGVIRTSTTWDPDGAGPLPPVLVAAGIFDRIESVDGGVSRIAMWNGSAWQPLGAGVTAATPTGFSQVWARFSEDGAPWIAGQPQGQVLACGSTFAPGLTPAAGYGGLVYQWRKNGIPLVDGPTGTGSTIVGATGNFGILNVSQADAGVYDCVLSNACGSSTSRSATLTVTGNCPGPCYANCDGSTTTPLLNINDFVCFLNTFAAADPYANCDGSTIAPVLNANDFVCYLNRFGAGCP
ncbi:MAG: hypothetical protein JNM80_09465 [Phycisphaerae bacterium]|nr:hypothetical protein [Phycisphaerae bacterium]